MATCAATYGNMITNTTYNMENATTNRENKSFNNDKTPSSNDKTTSNNDKTISNSTMPSIERANCIVVGANDAFGLPSHEEQMEIFTDLYDQLTLKITEAVSQVCQHSPCGSYDGGEVEDMKDNRMRLEEIVLTMELVCQLCVICGSCHKLLHAARHNKSAHGKKGRKKKGGTGPATTSQNQHITALVHELGVAHTRVVESLLSSVQKLSRFVVELQVTLTTDALQCLGLHDTGGAGAGGGEDWAGHVWSRCVRSYQQSCEEISDLLNKKIKYLEKLKL